MFKLQQTIFALIVILSAMYTTSAEELIEMDCRKNSDCEPFEKDYLKVNCTDNHCLCVDGHTRVRVSCRPKELLRTNIIGGNCPCNLPNSKCQLTHNICYCKVDYIPSVDKRRCLPEQVSLGGDCEMDKQCQALDSFAICDREQQKCRCQDHFVQSKGHCKSFHQNIDCLKDSDCDARAANSSCDTELNQCVCRDYHVMNDGSEFCVPGRTYQESCFDDNQCRLLMGVGSSCKKFQCLCNDDYIVIEEKIYPEKLISPIKMICEPLVVTGQYCRNDEQCHNRHLKDEYQPYNCKRGECGCRYGLRDAQPCPFRAAATTTMEATSNWLLIVNLVFVAIAAALRKWVFIHRN